MLGTTRGMICILYVKSLCLLPKKRYWKKINSRARLGLAKCYRLWVYVVNSLYEKTTLILISPAAVFPCEHCERTFQSRASLRNHAKQHLGRTQCSLCQQVYASVPTLRRHLLSIHGQTAEQVYAMVPSETRGRKAVPFVAETSAGTGLVTESGAGTGMVLPAENVGDVGSRGGMF